MDAAQRFPVPIRVLIALVGLALVAGACAERPVPFEPEPPVSPASAGGDGYVAVQGPPRLAAISLTRTIGPAGGEIVAGGVALRIPAGALAGPIAITMTVPAGWFTEVQLAPHGLQFDKAFSLTLPLHGTQVAAARTGGLVGIYAVDPVAADGAVNALQLLGLAVTGTVATLASDHFSGYLLGTNRH
jgi:hypothetical protein